ncbi:hypothetical protein BB561_003521 [Smittium simulii]|uniref:Glucose-6-phosphate isomerase n=1 Tax=Smittium simulii TaxID=133385 RepID=A0A2T9YKW4_9FUNG|nr:hypothetical protein BB561_003521 [Smittium simulii]
MYKESELIKKSEESKEKKPSQEDFHHGTDLNISITCENIKNISQDIRNKERKSVFESEFSSIVIIGIEGINLNYEIVSKAFCNGGSNIMMYFASDTEGSRIDDILQEIDFKSTLFIISCKTFIDTDTKLSVEAVKKFILKKIDEYNNDSDSDEFISFDFYAETHFLAVSNNRKLLKDLCISKHNTIYYQNYFDDSRFSLWSEMALPMSIYMGFENYYLFLEGCHIMDMHFRYNPIDNNMPVIMALLDFWYENFCGAKTFPILPYDHRLSTFATNFQRIDTEPEKKESICANLNLEHEIWPSIWSEDKGNIHSLLNQLIHQEKKVIPCDLIAAVKCPKSASDILSDKLILSNFFALSEALMKGSGHCKTLTSATLDDSSNVDDQVDNVHVNKAYAGNKPSNSIMITSDINPFTLGLLVSLYEHRKNIRDILNNDKIIHCKDIKLVNYFAKKILTELNDNMKVDSHDNSTNELINFYKNNS